MKLLGQIPGVREAQELANIVKGNDLKSGSGLTRAMRAGALLLGVSAIAYTKYRESYRSGFEESANMARNQGEGTAAPVVNAEQITFAIDNYTSQRGISRRGEEIASALKGIEGIGEQHHIVPVRGSVTLGHVARGANIGQEGVEAFRKVVGESVLAGRNPLAVDLAAQVYAYRKANPGKPINLIGDGVGGLAAQEAAEILKKIGTTAGVTKTETVFNQYSRQNETRTVTTGATSLTDKLRVVGINTPDIGLFDTVGQSATLTSRTGRLTRAPMKNPMEVGGGVDAQSMLADRRTQARLRGFLGAGGAQPTQKAAAASVKTEQKAAAEPATQKQEIKVFTLGSSKTSTPSSTSTPTATTSTFSASASVAKTTTLSEASPPDEESIAAKRRSMVGLANEIFRAGNNPDAIKSAIEFYPELKGDQKRIEQAIKLSGAPNIIRKMVQTGETQPAFAIRIAEEMKNNDDRGKMRDLLEELQGKGALDLNKNEDVNRLIAEFRRKWRSDSALDRWIAKRSARAA
jgi:hypothetical protein